MELSMSYISASCRNDYTDSGVYTGYWLYTNLRVSEMNMTTNRNNECYGAALRGDPAEVVEPTSVELSLTVDVGRLRRVLEPTREGLSLTVDMGRLRRARSRSTSRCRLENGAGKHLTVNTFQLDSLQRCLLGFHGLPLQATFRALEFTLI